MDDIVSHRVVIDARSCPTIEMNAMADIVIHGIAINDIVRAPHVNPMIDRVGAWRTEGTYISYNVIADSAISRAVGEVNPCGAQWVLHCSHILDDTILNDDMIRGECSKGDVDNIGCVHNEAIKGDI